MATALEKRIVQRGQRIYDLIEGQAPSLFKKGYWTTKMMDWAMHDEAFKTEMFRFVDVFPALDEPGEVTQHLREYFARPEQHFHELLQWGIKAVPPDSSVEKVLAAAVGSNIKGMGRQFILGETPEEALPVIGKLRETVSPSRSTCSGDCCFRAGGRGVSAALPRAAGCPRPGANPLARAWRWPRRP